MLLPDYIETWLMTFDSPATRKQYRLSAARLYNYLPVACNPATAGVDEVVRAAQSYDLAEKPSAWTWNATIAGWRSLYRHLEERHLVSENPARFLRSRPTPRRRLPSPDERELRQIWRWLGSAALWNSSTNANRRMILRNRAIFALLIGCALRSSEIRQLRVRSVNVDARILLFKRKNRGIVQQPWPPSADPYIIPVLAGKAPDDWLFVTRYGNPLDNRALNEVIWQVCRGAGVRRYTAHAFRRFAGTQMKRDHGIESAQAMLGHAHMSTTIEHYNQDRFDIPVGRLFDD